jgi:hypothetical protein
VGNAKEKLKNIGLEKKRMNENDELFSEGVNSKK